MSKFGIQHTSLARQNALHEWSNLGGAGLAQLQLVDFVRAFGQEDGEQLHGQLEVWKSTVTQQPPQQQQQQQQQEPQPSTSSGHRPVGKEDSFDINYVLQMLDSREQQQQQDDYPVTTTTTTSSVASSFSSPSTSRATSFESNVPPPPYPGHPMSAGEIKAETDEDDMEEGEGNKNVAAALAIVLQVPPPPFFLRAIDASDVIGPGPAASALARAPGGPSPSWRKREGEEESIHGERWRWGASYALTRTILWHLG